MKCQNLFSGKNTKSIFIFRLLKILPRVLNVKHNATVFPEIYSIMVLWDFGLFLSCLCSNCAMYCDLSI